VGASPEEEKGQRQGDRKDRRKPICGEMMRGIRSRRRPRRILKK
jgi:hypothetical protein